MRAVLGPREALCARAAFANASAAWTLLTEDFVEGRNVAWVTSVQLVVILGE